MPLLFSLGRSLLLCPAIRATGQLPGPRGNNFAKQLSMRHLHTQKELPKLVEQGPNPSRQIIRPAALIRPVLFACGVNV